MGKFLTLTVIAAATAASAALSGCNTTGCTENQSSLPLAGFYSMATQKAVTVRNIEIQGVDAPRDSVLYTPSQSLTQVYLPLRATKEETQYVFTFLSDQKDEEGNAVTQARDIVTFSYTAEPYFVSEECGAMYRYRIHSLDYTTTLIDSIGLTDSLVTNIDIETIRIYLRTDESGEGDGK